MLDHLGIQCADVPAAAAFYDTVLATLGATRIMDFGEVIGYGIGQKPDFWLGPVTSDAKGTEDHIAFVGRRPGQVRGVLRRRRGRTAPKCCTSPAVWPEYHPCYYGAFVRDPDGNNVEAVCHKPQA